MASYDAAQQSPPYWPTEGWRTSTPEEQGVGSNQLTAMLDFLQEQDAFNIHSLLIIRNGYVVTDAYFYPFARGSVHDLASVTKSFTATLIGIAIDKGYIESVQQPVLELFPERTAANLDANKEAMTLEDLLTMTSGFECIYQPTEITLLQMQASPDRIQFTLDLPMAAEPGTRYVYCSPNVHLLSAMIQQTSGMSALAFAQEHLFGPLGFSDAVWPSGPLGNNHGWGDLRVTLHDMAKLGYLYLHKGLWDGQQLLPDTWVTAATSPATHLPAGFSLVDSFGYLWWISSAGSFYLADGRGGQRILVLPEQEMVVVTTGGGGRDPSGVLETLLTTHIIPAAESTTPLTANPEGVALLESKIEQIGLAQAQAKPVPPLPEIAKRVSGQTYVLDANLLGLQSVSVAFEEQAEALLRVTFLDGNQVEWLAGLDNVYRIFSPGRNVYRISPGRVGLPAAAKGWWESDDVFAVHLDEIGNINNYRIKLTFEGNQVTFHLQEITGTGLGASVAGRLE